MAFIPLPQGIRVALEYSLQGEVVVNIYHVTWPNPVTTVSLTALAAVFKDWFGAVMAGEVTSELSLDRIIVTDVSVQNGQQVTYVTGLPLVGSDGAISSPNQVAVGITLNTGLAGRSYRGRSFIAGIGDAYTINNYISAAKASQLAAAMAQLVTDLDTAGYTLVVASYQANNLPRVTGVATPVISVACNTRIDTQRRRLPPA